MKRRIFENLVLVTPAAIENHFSHYPLDIKKKRGIELLAGCLISRVFEKLDGYLHEISIPVRERTSRPPTLGELIADPSLHVDEDVDLYLKNDNSSAHPIQVTELEKHFLGKDLDEGLFNLIRKKSKRSPDPDLVLAVIANIEGALKLDRIVESIEQISCPFCHIFLLAKYQETERFSRFSCHMLYPEFRESVEIEFNL